MTVQRFLSGSGTYTTPANAKYLIVKIVGGGSTGGSVAADPITGAASTFVGTGVNMTAGPGTSGGSGGVPGIGGGSTGGDINLAGGDGGAGNNNTTTTSGLGGASFFGGGGGSARNNEAGLNARVPGSGGGGAATGSNARAGGGAGGYCEKLITSPAASYSYVVGAGGTGVANAGNGANGIVIVEEYY